MMKLKKPWFFPSRAGIVMLIMLVLSFSEQALSQQLKTITGTVLEAGQPLPGVTVRVKGTNRGATTLANGRYSIQAASNETLVFAFLGMVTQETVVGNRTSVNITLQVSSSSLSEVVVIGYGTVAKPDLTGSVGVVPMDDMMKAPVGTFAEALAGRVAGVKVNASDGQPGGGINIVIRGAGSLTQSTSPLFVIDGFPVENPDPASINPEEIESMTILKDASSTAIYGSRAANGVILIQTKRGSVGKPVINFASSYGLQSVPEPMDVMSPYEFIKYQTELNPLSATTRAFFAGGKTLEDYRSTEGINFQDYVLQQGTIQSYNLALRGGTDQTKYSISGSLFDQTGSIINTGLNRYSGRVTLDQTISNKIKAGITANYSGIKQFGQVINQGAVTSGNPTAFALARAWLYRPITPNPTDDLLSDLVDDEALNASDFRINPFIDLQNQHSFNITSLVEGNGYLSYQINKDLNIKSTAGIRHNKLTLERFYNSKTAQGGSSPNNVNGVNGSINNVFSNSFSNETTLNYKKTFKKDHTVTGLGLFAINSSNTEGKGYGGRLLPNENLGMDGLDEGLAFNQTSNSSRNSMASYAGRLDYNYKSKYIITGTFRADGSSKFQEHWGYFPGAALAWNMHKEGFFAKLLPGVSTSKLRTSYGSNGNNRVGDFDTYARLLQNIDGYSFNNSTPIASNYVSAVGNPALAWEKVNTIDLGYEIGVLKDRITLEVDLYRKTTENLLLNAILPPSTGFGSAVKNIGKLRNDGLEFTLNTVNVQSKNFTWESNLNISFNKNKVMELTRGQRSLPSNSEYVSQFNKPLYVAEIGKPAGMMIGFIWEGNYQYSDFDNPSPGVYILKPSVPTNGAVRNTILPGDIKYRDINGDGIMNDADLTFIGRGQPIHTGGFSNNFNYKAFSLNVFFQWSYGNDIYNANRLIMEGNSNGWANINQFASYSNRWSPENPTNANYRTRGQGPIGFHSSRVVEDGSFLRMKTVSLNYNLPAKLIKTAYLSNLSVNVSAQNLITWTNYSGMDPEVSTRNNTLTPGFDYSSYPKAPTIAFGIKAGF
ncbi:TonB-linked outer membrane protein, SusC/RagA family [Daejeonella rubra]|uniref:TonB-linked outer membrane protein, SusC/RagA family n=2 Tax=Daejeonella rubra TaxID=990371 RepID=A0A1G9S4M9_9SPHI|nr:TonB-linked outer membrane protein, SusC/RagA family [Daejeonella rubra]